MYSVRLGAGLYSVQGQATELNSKYTHHAGGKLRPRARRELWTHGREDTPKLLERTAHLPGCIAIDRPQTCISHHSHSHPHTLTRVRLFRISPGSLVVWGVSDSRGPSRVPLHPLVLRRKWLLSVNEREMKASTGGESRGFTLAVAPRKTVHVSARPVPANHRRASPSFISSSVAFSAWARLAAFAILFFFLLFFSSIPVSFVFFFLSFSLDPFLFRFLCVCLSCGWILPLSSSPPLLLSSTTSISFTPYNDYYYCCCCWS